MGIDYDDEINKIFKEINKEVTSLSGNSIEDKIKIMKTFNNEKVNKIYDLAGRVFMKLSNKDFYYLEDKSQIPPRSSKKLNGLEDKIQEQSQKIFKGFSNLSYLDYNDFISCIVNNLKEYYIDITSYILEKKQEDYRIYHEYRFFYRNKLVDCLQNLDLNESDMQKLDTILNLKNGDAILSKKSKYSVNGIEFKNSTIYNNGVQYIQNKEQDVNKRRLLFAIFAYVLTIIEKNQKPKNLLAEILSILKRNIGKVGIKKEDFDLENNSNPILNKTINVDKKNKDMGNLYIFINYPEREKVKAERVKAYNNAINQIFDTN